MQKLTASSTKNPCPVCDRTKDGDCRVSADGNLVHCKTYAEGAAIEGWHYLGKNQLGFQGQFRRKEDDQAAKYTKTPRPKSGESYFYPSRHGGKLVKVNRTDDGQGGKKFAQYHWSMNDRWETGNPPEFKAQVAIYQWQEVREAINKGETIFVVEGESAVHALRELGIMATTTIGGSGGYSNYGSYSEDLAGARLVLCPDRDELGMKYVSNFERDFPSQIVGYYLAGSPALWKHPQGGMDIHDDIRDHGLDREQILAKVVDQAAYQSLTAPIDPEPAPPKKFQFVSDWTEGLAYETDIDGSQKRVAIGNHLVAIANTENPEGGDTGVLLEFRNRKGASKRLQVSHAGLVGDGLEVLKELATRGYYYHRKQRNLLLDYLFSLGEEVERTIVVSDKSGWVNASFLTPAKTYGDPDLCFRDPEPDHSLLEFRGALEEWKSAVAAKCDGNSRLIFALGCAFAAPMLDIAQIESGGFHLVGGTSIGKTTALNLAASVAGIKSLPNWRSTANALEGKAMEFNHMLLPLDEIGQADPISVGAAAYMLGNGQGKNRMGKTLATIKPKTWELLFLSTGEVSMDDYLGKAGLTVKGGMETRMPSFPADAGAGYGVFENLHGHQTAKEFVQALESAVNKHRGHALDFFLTKLVEQRQEEGFDKQIRDRVHKIAGGLSQQFEESAVGRVAVRLALVQVGLELAHDCNLLPFPIEQCGWAVSVMLADWLNLRGGAGSIEVKAACARIEYLFVSSQLSDRIAIPGQNAIVRNLLAWRMRDTVTDGEEYLVPPPVFERELAAGVDREALVQELVSRGWLKPATEKGRYLLQRRVNGSKARFFVFAPFWMEEENQKSIILLGTPGTPGTPIENGSVSTIQAQEDVPIKENLLGTPGTDETNLANRSVPVYPLDENQSGATGTGEEHSSGLDSNELYPSYPSYPSEIPMSRSISLNPENDDIPAPCPEGVCLCKIGGILRRIGHRVKGKYFARIAQATIESSSQDGWWVVTPSGDRLHVSNEAIDQGWWEVVA